LQQLLQPEQGGLVMTKKSLDPSIMSQFTGMEHWYRHGLVRNITFTDGAKYVADTAGAYWLLDEIALAQKFDARVAAEEFQVWKLTVKDDHSATLICEDGNYNVVSTKPIPFTDFPEEGVTLWFENNVIYLPSEH
jgi:hypothetical protein